MAHFPFKAPEDNVRLWSADRFFLVRGLPLFLVLFMMTAVVGALFTTGIGVSFYAFMLLGFVLALLAEKFVFVDADLKSEVNLHFGSCDYANDKPSGCR